MGTRFGAIPSGQDGITPDDLADVTGPTALGRVSGTGAPQALTPAQIREVASVSDNVTVTVGAGGDYATISEALAFLSAGAPRFVAAGLTAEISLLTGFVMAEQITITGLDLSWIAITSVDATVTVQRSALTAKPYRWYAAWTIDRATAPRMLVTFSMDTSGTGTNRVGFYIRNRSTVLFGNDSGFMNAADRNVDCPSGSALICDGEQANPVDFSGAGIIGVRISNGSTMMGDGVRITGCGTANLSIAGSSKVNCPDAILTGSLGDAVTVVSSIVELNEADLSNAAGNGLYVRSGFASLVAGIAEDCGANGVWAAGAAYVDLGTDGSATPASLTGCNIGILAEDASIVDARQAVVSNSVSHGIYARHSATVNFRNGVAVDCGGAAIFADAASTVSASTATLTGATGTGASGAILSGKASRVDIFNANASGSTATNGLVAIDGGQIAARNANVQKGASPATGSSADARVLRGGMIYADGLTGGLSTTANTLTAAGVIFQ